MDPALGTQRASCSMTIRLNPRGDAILGAWVEGISEEAIASVVQHTVTQKAAAAIEGVCCLLRHTGV